MATLMGRALAATLFFASASAGAAGWRWLQPLPVAADLRDVWFADASLGYAVGAGGTVLRTRDGGATWEVRPLSSASSPNGDTDLAAVAALGRRAVAVGPGVAWLTTDGGETFSSVRIQVSSADETNLVDVVVVDSNNGFALSRDGTIWTSRNGFASLEMVSRIDDGRANALYFDTPMRGWVVGGSLDGASGWVRSTTDGGQRFRLSYTAPGGPLRALKGLSFGVDAMVLAAGDGRPRAVYSATNQTAWNPVDLPTGPITGISVMPLLPQGAEFWFAAQDGLAGWRDGDPAPQAPIRQDRPRLWALASPVAGTVVAVGDGGTVVRATYGQTYAVTLAGNRRELFTGGDFPGDDGQFGVLVDNQPGSPRGWVTYNGAVSFQQAGTAPPSPIAGISFVDSQTGFGALLTGEIFATGDGGNTWVPRTRLTGTVRGIAFQSASEGYAAAGALLATYDGGTSWRQAYSASNANVVSVAVKGGLAAAVTDRGAVLVRGGSSSSSWTVVSSGGGSLASVAVSTDGRVLAGGTQTGGGRLWLWSRTAPTIDTSTSSAVLSVAAAGTRFFALLANGDVAEVDAGGNLFNRFSSHAHLKALVGRVSGDAAGRVSAAPLAMGDFGALLLFEDQPTQNRPPVVQASPQVITLGPGAAAPLQATASDPDGQPLTFRWWDATGLSGVAGLAFSPTDQPFTAVSLLGAPPAGMRLTARITVCDPLNACASADVTVVAAGPPNRPPKVSVTPPSATITPGVPLVLAATAIDPEGQPVTFEWMEAIPPGATVHLRFDPTGAPTTRVMLTDPVPPGTMLIARVTACDPMRQCSSMDVPLRVAGGPNRPPTVRIQPPRLDLAFGAVAGLGAMANDPDGDPLTYQWTAIPVAGGTPLILRATDQPKVEVRWASQPPPGTAVTVTVRVCDTGNLCADASAVVVFAGGMNRPPVAVAVGASAFTGSTAIVDGSGSNDPDNDPLTYQWVQLSGAPLAIQGSNRDPILVVTTPSTAGTSTVQLTVCDPGGLCARAEALVIATPPAQNRPPVAQAPGDFEVPAGAEFKLDGTASYDPDGDLLTFSWRQMTADPVQIRLRGADTAQAVGTAGTSGEYRFILRVCDPQNACSEAGVKVTVTGGPINRPPVVTPEHAEITARSGDTVVLRATVADPDGDALVPSEWFSPMSDVLLRETGAWTSEFVAPPVPAQRDYPFELRVCDTVGLCGTAQVIVHIQPGSVRPVADAGRDVTVGFGALVQLDGRGSNDPAGRALDFRWTAPAGLALHDAATATPRFTAPQQNGVLSFTLRVCARGTSDCAEATVKVTVQTGGNLPPIADAGPDQSAESEGTVRLDGSRSLDPEGGTLTATWRQLVGPEARIATPDAVRTDATMPATTQTVGLQFELRVCDAAGACTSDWLTITVFPGGSGPPQLSFAFVTPADGRVPEDSDLRLSAAAHCPFSTCRAVDIRLAEGPPLARQSGDSLSWRSPRVLTDLPFLFEAKVCDEAGHCSSTQRLVGVVMDTINEPPTAIAADVTDVRPGSTAVLDATQSWDPNGESITFSWRAVDAADPLQPAPVDVPRPRLAVPSDARGDHRYEVTVCDPRGGCAKATTLVHVDFSPQANRPPIADAGPDLLARVGTDVRLDGRASEDPDGDSLTFTWSVGVTDGSAEVTSANEPLTVLRVKGAGEPVTVQLEVCDAQGACTKDETSVRRYELPPETEGGGNATLGAQVASCGCGPDSLAAWPAVLALVPMLRRRRRA